MPMVRSGEFNINYEVTCEGEGPTLLLVHGFGDQIGAVEWPEEQCNIFADMGFRVVRMDNRDAGLSVPIVENVKQYTHQDMGDDVAAVIDDLNCGPVHLVGCSLGGFIVRWATIRHPQKIKTLTVVMSGTGASPEQDAPQVPEAAGPKLGEYIIRRSISDQIEWQVGIWRDWLWGNKYPFPEEWVKERVTYAVNRSYTPDGYERTLNASGATPPLYEEQSKITCPTLIMHGGEDPVFPRDHAEANTKMIKGATLWFDEKMGHIMHEEQWHEMAERLKSLAEVA